MSKSKTLIYAILSTAAAVGVIMFAGSDAVVYTPCISTFLFFAVIFGCRFGYQHWRDQAIIQRAREIPAVPARLEAPPMTSKGSSRLFVPPPLDRRS